MLYTNPPILDDRLFLAASFVREGSAVADIGTDHAYIPINLLMTGRASFAIAADINEGPLQRARENADRFDLDRRCIEFCLADGLSGLPLSENDVSDIIICGMGGELIASIIDASDYAKKSGVRLILQPMSAISKLRAFLNEKGFREIDCDFATVQDKLYQCIVCEYDGSLRSSSPAELELGDISLSSRSPLFPLALKKLIERTERTVKGRKTGGLDTDSEETLLRELYEIRKNEVDHEDF